MVPCVMDIEVETKDACEDGHSVGKRRTSVGVSCLENKEMKRTCVGSRKQVVHKGWDGGPCFERVNKNGSRWII